MAKKKRTSNNSPPLRDKVRAQVQIAKHQNVSRVVSRLVRTAIICGTVLLGLRTVMRYSLEMTQSLSGQHTIADVVFRFLADLRVNTIVSWTAAAGGVVYGVRQHKLRERNIKRMSSRSEHLERTLNPDRGSSNISVTGRSNEEDKW